MCSKEKLMSISKIQSKEIKSPQFFIAAILICACLTVNKANAEPGGLDVFSVNPRPSNVKTQPVNKPAATHKAPWEVSSDNAPLAAWFVKYDQLRSDYRPTEKDKVILTRPLMQQAERVQQWTNTANKVSKNYKLLAKTIRTLTVPSGLSDIKEYRDLMADWYEDAAEVYLDLIRPRPAAKTIEDLQEQLDAVKKRSEGLANNISNLKNMDRELRQRYNIQPALQDDAIQQFVRSK